MRVRILQSLTLCPLASGGCSKEKATPQLIADLSSVQDKDRVIAARKLQHRLPEAQLDRFAMKLSIGYPDRDDEMDMLADAIGTAANGKSADAVLTPLRLRGLQEAVAAVAVSAAVRAYVVDLGRATRSHPRVTLGLSPRGLLTWQRAAQARAFLSGRPFVTPDDVQ